MTAARALVALVAIALAGVAHAANPSFAGTWTFNPAASQNVGMMAAIKQSIVITEGGNDLVMKETTDFNGQVSNREVRYDLSGKPVTNEGAMGGKATTVSKWDGGKLVTTWTSEGAVAGTTTVRTETRSLSADGKQMSVQTVRGENKPVVMVFEKAK
jgi:hypothetical protein